MLRHDITREINVNVMRLTRWAQVFKNSVGLKRHLSYVHEKKRPPRDKICDYCGRGFTTLAILRAHIRTHTGARPLHCAHCAASFAHSAALHNHVKLHKGAR
ncbi:zinc finger X-chromosomal protein-like [Choristoneura fumiferana]|uniref:zinc finger X-chromosomal protein-like n=1 Tax=Choristoneura fumiferana TaxID=7141 RepID=UPI003D154B15